MNIDFSPPDITEAEINAVVEAMRSGWITTGPKTKEFEQRIAEYIGVPKAVCLNSATAALELVLRLLGVGPGDEVITSAYTYTASASVIDHVGAKIVLVDTGVDSFEMDYQKLSDAITSKTKVIIPIDIGGVICDYESIFNIVENKRYLFRAKNKIQELFNRIIVLGDAAHAFGAEQKYLKCGQIADFTCFSFHAVKNLTTAEGGAVVWKDINRYQDKTINNDWFYNELMLYSLHGQSKDALTKAKGGSWEYDIIGTWYKCNMTDILASIGQVQLERYSEILKRRKEIIKKYDDAFVPLGVETLPHFTEKQQSSGHLYITRIPGIALAQRNKIIFDIAEHGITCNVHYKPLPMHTAYKNMGFDIKNYVNAYTRFANAITLPLHTCLTDEQVEYVIKNFTKIIKEYMI